MSSRVLRRIRNNPSAILVDGLTWVLLAFGALVMGFPLFWMLTGSLKTTSEIFAIPIVWIPASPNWEAFRTVFMAANMGGALLNSLIVAVSTMLSTLLFCSMAGYAFAKFRHRGMDILFTGVLAMVMIPMTVILIPMYITALDLNLLDTYPGLMLPRLVNAFGIFLFRQTMLGIPNDLIDAARMDGANEFQIYWRIALPLSRAAVVTLGILSFMWAWNDFLWPIMISNSEAIRTIMLAVSLIQALRSSANRLSTKSWLQRALPSCR